MNEPPVVPQPPAPKPPAANATRQSSPKQQHPAQTAATLVITIGLLVLLIFIAIVSVAANYFGMMPDLPMHVVGSAIALLAAVAFCVVALSFFGLSDKTQALGLPDGSVRAILALLLLVIFAVMGLHFFDRITNATQPNADIAKQLITILGTLVASISSFYFGSQAVASATKAAAGTPTPAISSIVPAYGTTGKTVSAVIYGTDLLQVDRVALSRNGTTVAGTNVRSNATSITCDFTVDASAEEGDWDVSVETSDKKSDTRPAAFSIRKSGMTPTLTPPAQLLAATQGEQNIPITINGDNLQLVTKLHLENSGTKIPANEPVTSNATIVKATINIPPDATPTKWDLVIETSDNQSARLVQVFVINPKT